MVRSHSSSRRYPVLLAAAFGFVISSPVTAAPAYAADDGWTGTMTSSQLLTQGDYSGSRSIKETATFTIAGPDLDSSAAGWQQTITYTAHWDIALNFNNPGYDECVSTFSRDESGTGSFLLLLNLSTPSSGIYDLYTAQASSTPDGFQYPVPGCPGWTQDVNLWAALAGAPAYLPLPSDPSHLSGTQDQPYGNSPITSTWDLSIDPAVLPTPIVPEAPLAILLPLGAGALLVGTFVIARRRWGRLES